MFSAFLIMSLFLLLVLVKGVFLQATTNETNTKLTEFPTQLDEGLKFAFLPIPNPVP